MPREVSLEITTVKNRSLREDIKKKKLIENIFRLNPFWSGLHSYFGCYVVGMFWYLYIFIDKIKNMIIRNHLRILIVCG